MAIGEVGGHYSAGDCLLQLLSYRTWGNCNPQQCNGSAPGSAIKKCPEMCVCVYTSNIKGRHGCVYVCVSVITTLPSKTSCVCMYVYVC